MNELILSKRFNLKESHKLQTYLSTGGYRSAERALKTMKPEAIVEEVKVSNLRGFGGAGFSTGMKWSFLPKERKKPVYLVVNADEGEPGTFKDRYIMEKDPHLLIEGILITSFAIGSHKAYVYIRGEYVKSYRILQGAVDEAYAKGYLGKNIFGTGFDLEVMLHMGAGAYICGEETALLESLEGKKGFPRLKPPFPAIIGLFGCPTIINNVETLSCLPTIIERGGKAFADLGCEKNGGTHLYSLSGHVERPGVYELRMGTPLRDLIYKYGGGIRGGKQLKAVVPGGMSAAVLKANEIDVGLDYESLKKAGTMLGSAGIIVMDETTCMVEALLVTARFFAHESCGQCSPCREGTGWYYKVVQRIYEGKGRMQDLETLMSIPVNMGGNTICAFADGAAMPFSSYPVKFREEFEQHIREGKCNPTKENHAYAYH
ncbi:MAG: NADH-quinone oxidoreductase subunit NuoF [Candidatus Omnitrophica bacterium]|nr:NADH-quinone oxidoreductase subunit NuoF [Candidatus Omnitrophota bacterium]